MSQFYVPGPARIFAGVGAAGALEFLGFSMDGAMIAIQPRFDDVFSDLGGPAVPEDVQFLGHDARITFQLSRFNAGTFHKVRQFLPGMAGAVDGGMPNYSIGSLLKAEGLAMRLLVRATYGPTSPGAKAAYATQRGVYNFPLAYPAEVIETPVSVRTQLPRMTFRAFPDFISDQGGYTLYNDSAAGEPAID